MRKLKKIVLIVVAASFLIQSAREYFHAANFVNSQIYADICEEENRKEAINDELTVQFIDVGQGDCSLVKYKDFVMLIDAGDNTQGTAIQNFLQKQGIEEIDYLILTHPHADHIGGADVIITKFIVHNIIMTDFSSETATYRDVIAAISYKGYSYTVPVAGDEIFVDNNLQIQFVAPNGDYMIGDANNASIAVKMVYKEASFLFMGDCEEEAENKILDMEFAVDVDILKVAHHGSRTSSTEKFLEATTPLYAVISCGEENDYGHPHSGPLNLFRQMGIEVYRTDEQGTLTVTTDGVEYDWNCDSSQTWQSGS